MSTVDENAADADLVGAPDPAAAGEAVGADAAGAGAAGAGAVDAGAAGAGAVDAGAAGAGAVDAGAVGAVDAADGHPPARGRTRWPARRRKREPAGDPSGEPTRGPTRRPTGRRVAAAACVAALSLAGACLFGAGLAARDPAASGNRALTDAAATDQVTGDVSSALSRIFAYTPDGTQATAQAADQVLGGTAARQYRALFARIRGEVAAQRLTLTTRVVRAGVVFLSADRARLLVFLDQSAQRAGGPVTGAAAQLSVTARLEGGHWRITELKAR